jgi:hypothetical protein
MSQRRVVILVPPSPELAKTFGSRRYGVDRRKIVVLRSQNQHIRVATFVKDDKRGLKEPDLKPHQETQKSENLSDTQLHVPSRARIV